MFDSAYSYNDNTDLEYININLPFNDSCNIKTYKYETDDVSLLVHVFQQAQPAWVVCVRPARTQLSGSLSWFG